MRERISDIRRDVLDSIEHDDAHLHNFMDTGWNRNAAVHALANVSDRTLRRYYRTVSGTVLEFDGRPMALGAQHNSKVYNIAEALGR